MGVELEALAESFIARWDEFASREWRSNKFGFEYAARQTDFEKNLYTISKAFVSGLTLEHHRVFRENQPAMIPLFDDRLTAVQLPDFEGKTCILTNIKMPMMISNRSVVSLYYNYEKPDGSFVSISSSKNTDAVVAQVRD